MPTDSRSWIDFFLVLVPLIAGALLVLYMAYRRISEGLGPLDLFFDRKFQITFLYTGALLAIWLSCIHFVRLLLGRTPA